MKNTLICSRTAKVHVLLRHMDVIWLVYSYLFYKCGGVVVQWLGHRPWKNLCQNAVNLGADSSLAPAVMPSGPNAANVKKIIISCLYYLKLMRIKLFVHVVCVFFYQFAKFNAISLVTVDEMVS